MDWQAISLSFQLATLTSLLLLLIGLPLSYWLAVSKWKWKFVVEAIASLPLVLPPTVLGFYLLIAIGPQSGIGQIFYSLTGGQLPFSFCGLLLGSIVYSFPFAIQPFFSAFSSLDHKLVETSWCLGKTRWQTFFSLILPLCFPGIITGVILSFAHTLGEFGVVLMIGGNIPGVTRTLSLSIFDDVQAMDYASAAKTSGVLLCFSFFALLATSMFRKKRVQAWQPGS